MYLKHKAEKQPQGPASSMVSCPHNFSLILESGKVRADPTALKPGSHNEAGNQNELHLNKPIRQTT